MLYSKTLLMLVFGIFWLQLIRVNLMGNPESNFWSWRLPRNLCGTTCPHTSQLQASRIQEPCVSAANACECREEKCGAGWRASIEPLKWHQRSLLREKHVPVVIYNVAMGNHHF